MRRFSRWITHLFTALGMLLVLMVVLFVVLGATQNLPVIGGAAQWAGQHASGSSEGF